MPEKRLELIYAGNFSGIDFRDQAERFAVAHKLTGHVFKDAEGRMKVVAEGEEGELNAFLHDFNEYMDEFIEHYSKMWLESRGEYDRFRISNI